MKRWEHLKIPFKEIKTATDNFKTCIGKGGYGLVYKGELSIDGIPTKVAVKRLDEKFGQGLKEFLTEIQLLCGQEHPNLISLIGYCDEIKEKIIVYGYAERGSLDRYIRRFGGSTNSNLTWRGRLKICGDAARGLDHLHNGVGKHQTVIHRDIKSANILIDDKWVGKISDLGLSRLSLAGLDRSTVISHACGTPGYCEPEYVLYRMVKKESDVYSFGMVLFEVLCGRLCMVQESDGIVLTEKLVKEYYENGKIEEIIDPSLREQTSQDSMIKFAEIAYRCLAKEREDRPSMDLVTKVLEELLKNQEEYELEKEKKLKDRLISEPDKYWETKLPQDWREIETTFISSGTYTYTTKKELFYLLHKGILFDHHNQFFWINDENKKCLYISARRFLSRGRPGYPRWVPQLDSRFSDVAKYQYQKGHEISCEIKGSMLSVDTMYAASLVFKYHQSNKDPEPFKWMVIKWKTKELSICSSHDAELMPDNWYKIRVFHFVNQLKNADFDIVIEELSYIDGPVQDDLLIQGFEFKPIEMMQEAEIEVVKDFKNEEDIDDDEYWEKKLPDAYHDYIRMSDKLLHFTTKKELYLRLSHGFLADNGKIWFSLCKFTDGICSMVPATKDTVRAFNYDLFDTLHLSESRFGEVKKLKESYFFSLECRLRPIMFSPDCIYACYLVFKFEDNYDTLFNFSRLLKIEYALDDDKPSQGDNISAHLSFTPPMINIPTIKPNNDYGNMQRSGLGVIKMPKGPKEYEQDTWMEKRKDGWMEVMVCKSLRRLQDHKLLKVSLDPSNRNILSGIIVEGIEFRPCI